MILEILQTYNTLKRIQGEIAHIAARPCQKHRGKPLLFAISAMGSFMCIKTCDFKQDKGQTNNKSGKTGTRTHTSLSEHKSLHPVHFTTNSYKDDMTWAFYYNIYLTENIAYQMS